MLVCNYCGRNFKNEFNTCPGCGSTTFNRVSDFGEKVIKKPPEGGYVINVDNFEKSKKMANIVKWIGWGLLIFMITFDLPFLLGGILAGQEDLLFGLTFSITSLVVTIPFVIISIESKRSFASPLKYSSVFISIFWHTNGSPPRIFRRLTRIELKSLRRSDMTSSASRFSGVW